MSSSIAMLEPERSKPQKTGPPRSAVCEVPRKEEREELLARDERTAGHDGRGPSALRRARVEPAHEGVATRLVRAQDRREERAEGDVEAAEVPQHLVEPPEPLPRHDEPCEEPDEGRAL